MSVIKLSVTALETVKLCAKEWSLIERKLHFFGLNIGKILSKKIIKK